MTRCCYCRSHYARRARRTARTHGRTLRQRSRRSRTLHAPNNHRTTTTSILVPSAIVLLYNMVLTTTSKPTFLALSLFDHLSYYYLLYKAGVKKKLLGTVLAYYGHTTRKQGSCLEKEIMQGTMAGARRQGRPCMAWMDNIKTWTGLPVEESIRMTEDRDKWRK